MEVKKRKEIEISKGMVVIKRETGERKRHEKKRRFKIKDTRELRVEQDFKKDTKEWLKN